MNHLARIKGMVCQRCISTVRTAFLDQGFIVTDIELGEVSYRLPSVEKALDGVRRQLAQEGFEIIDSKQAGLLARVEVLVEEWIQTYATHGVHFSTFISEAVHLNYNSISTLFSQTHSYTLEQHIIRRRVQLAQQLLAKPECLLTDIAFQLGYSSVHHLSNQFKKQSGMSPSSYRALLLSDDPMAAPETENQEVY